MYEFGKLCVLKLLPNFFFMARPKGLRFTSEKIDSNFSHGHQALYTTLRILAFITILGVCGVKNIFAGQVNSELGSYILPLEEVKMASPGYDVELTRTYSSLSANEGLFGYGWRTNIQFKFEHLPNGFVKIWDEHGYATVFKPSTVSADMEKEIAKKVFDQLPSQDKNGDVLSKLTSDKAFLEKKINELVINKIVERFPSGSQKDIRDQILKSDVIRQRLASQLQVTVVRFPLNTAFVTHDRGPEKLEYKEFTVQKGSVLKKETGYVRTYLVTGKKEIYDEMGRLTQQQDESGNFLQYSYGQGAEKNLVQKIQNKTGQFIKLEYNKEGLISSYVASNGWKGSYKYEDKRKLLIESVDAAGKKSTFEYDASGRLSHLNMPLLEETMSFYGDGRLKTYSVKGSELTTHYAYEPAEDIGSALNNKTVITRKYEKGDFRSTDVRIYERWYGIRDNGTRFLKKHKTISGNETVETELSECCGKPLMIVQTLKDPTGRQPTSIKKATFKYDTLSRLVEKVQPNGQIVKLDYFDGNFAHKIKRVVRGNLDLQFEYNDAGDVKKATRVEKIGDLIEKTTSLVQYDSRGRVESIIDQGADSKARVVKFEHDTKGNPIKIELKGIGTIFVEYDENGKPKKITSQKGQEVAVQVMEMFNKLIGILEPAGVKLSL